MIGCRALTLREEKKLMRALSTPRDRAIVAIGFATGLRISEILQLTKSDVFTKTGVRRRIYIDKDRMKGKQRGRVIYLDDRAARALKSLAKTRTPGKWLFAGYKNDHLQRNEAHCIIKEAAERAGLNTEHLSAHSMRKTFATKAYKVFDKNLSLVQAVIGHQDIKSTMRYIEDCDEKHLWKRVHRS